jgi:hypothetical protein
MITENQDIKFWQSKINTNQKSVRAVIPFGKHNSPSLLTHSKMVYFHSHLITNSGLTASIFMQDKIKEVKGLRINNPNMGIVINGLFMKIGTYESFPQAQIKLMDILSSDYLNLYEKDLLSENFKHIASDKGRKEKLEQLNLYKKEILDLEIAICRHSLDEFEKLKEHLVRLIYYNNAANSLTNNPDLKEFRFIRNRQAVRLETNEELGKGVNVIYHPFYKFTEFQAKEVAKVFNARAEVMK